MVERIKESKDYQDMYLHWSTISQLDGRPCSDYDLKDIYYCLSPHIGYVIDGNWNKDFKLKCLRPTVPYRIDPDHSSLGKVFESLQKISLKTKENVVLIAVLNGKELSWDSGFVIESDFLKDLNTLQKEAEEAAGEGNILLVEAKNLVYMALGGEV